MRIRPRCERFGLALLFTGSLLAGACRTGNAINSASFESIEAKIDELSALTKEALRTPGHIDVHLTGQGENTRLHKITPPIEALCKKDSTPDCMDQVTWRLLPNVGRLPSGWRVKISEKDDSPTEGCFPIKWLDAGNNGQVQSGEPAESCKKRWTVWAYDVTLVDGSGAPRSTIDPLLVMYNY